MNKNLACLWVGLILLGLSGPAQAQLVAQDDDYGMPYGPSLMVEAPGVLENDTFNEDPATDFDATAELLVYPNYGSLRCESQPAFDLCPDGSFTYTPDTSFNGTDSFVYQANVEGELNQATVTLTACTGGPPVFTCWKEAPYLAKLGELGYSNFQEGFEDDTAWGSVREPLGAPFVISQGIRWETNHPDPPANNLLTTGTGPRRTGMWGVYDPDHGYATGTPAECDITDPPPHCLFNDGFTGIREGGESTLYGVGGYFTGGGVPNLVMILDGGTPIGLGLVFVGDFQYFGVIDTNGFTSFRVEETDGKIGQTRLVFADDFTFGTTPSDTTPPQVALVNSFADTGDGELAEGEETSASITQLLVTFDELIPDTADIDPDSVTNPANYLLFSDGGDGFDTVDCATGVDPGDVAFPVDFVTYVSGSEITATLDINLGLALPSGAYRFLVCGTTSIRDGAGNALDGDGNGTGGDDCPRNFTVAGTAVPPGFVTGTLRMDFSDVTPGDLRLSWSPSCSSGATDYAIYEGTLGSYYSHVMKDCTDGGSDLREDITPQGADSYYLVVPLNGTDEGSYGLDSNVVERPVAPNACRSSQTLGGC